MSYLSLGGFVTLAPYDFIRATVKVTWRDVMYGLERGYLYRFAAVEHAMIELATNENPSDELVELASLTKADDVHPLVDKLAAQEKESGGVSPDDKWLYILLAWTYTQRERLSTKELLEWGEWISGDWKYPTRVQYFLSPTYYPDDGEPFVSHPEWRDMSLPQRWRSFLDSEKRRIGIQRGSDCTAEGYGHD